MCSKWVSFRLFYNYQVVSTKGWIFLSRFFGSYLWHNHRKILDIVFVCTYKQVFIHNLITWIRFQIQLAASFLTFGIHRAKQKHLHVSLQIYWGFQARMLIYCMKNIIIDKFKIKKERFLFQMSLNDQHIYSWVKKCIFILPTDISRKFIFTSSTPFTPLPLPLPLPLDTKKHTVKKGLNSLELIKDATRRFSHLF